MNLQADILEVNVIRMGPQGMSASYFVRFIRKEGCNTHSWNGNFQTYMVW